MTEDVDGTGRGEEPAAGETQERRLSRPVGPEDHPALARAHLPVDPVQDRTAWFARGFGGAPREGKTHAPEGEHRGVRMIRFLFHRAATLAAALAAVAAA
jgi:hypothetical protein